MSISDTTFSEYDGAIAPAVSSAGKGRIYFDSTSNTFQISQNGQAYDTLQPSFFGNKIGLWTALGNSTTVTVINIGNSATGTATARNVGTGTFAAQLRQLAYVSAGTAGASCGTRHNLAQFWRGNQARFGGFYYRARFVIDTVVAGMRWFVGMLNGTAVIGNVNPSTLINMIGFGIDAGQTTVRFFNNDGSGTATATDLGANFPATTAAVVYDVTLFCAQNGALIGWSCERLDSSFLSTSTVSTDIPANTTLLAPQVWMNNGATASAVAISVVQQYVETDY
jgi:hypothetical protein